MRRYYESGTYDPQAERQEARNRYLERLAKRDLAEQAMTDKLREEEEQLQYESETDTFSPSLQGASMGSAGGPWGALIGAIAGRVAGGVQSFGARREKGEGTGKALFESFINPMSDIRGMGRTFSGKAGPGATQAGARVAGSLGGAYGKSQRQREASGLLKETQGQEGPISIMAPSEKNEEGFRFSDQETRLTPEEEAEARRRLIEQEYGYSPYAR